MIEVVRPFRCEQCRAEVEPGGGGLCGGCGRLLCAHHFPIAARGGHDIDDPRYECAECQARRAADDGARDDAG